MDYFPIVLAWIYNHKLLQAPPWDQIKLALSYAFFNTNFCFMIHYSRKCCMEPHFPPKSGLIPKLADLPTLLNWCLQDQLSSKHLDPTMALRTESHPAEPITPTQPPLGETSPTCPVRKAIRFRVLSPNSHPVASQSLWLTLPCGPAQLTSKSLSAPAPCDTS